MNKSVKCAKCTLRSITKIKRGDVRRMRHIVHMRKTSNKILLGNLKVGDHLGNLYRPKLKEDYFKTDLKEAL
jgi:hypothetical protein